MPYPRTFSTVFGIDHGQPAFTYIWDPNLIVTGGNPSQLLTGGMRVASPADYAANVSVSGLSLTVGAVALTGTNVVTLTGITPVTIAGFNNAFPLYVTGSFGAVGGGGGLVTGGGGFIGITGNPGVTVTGFNAGVTVNVNNAGGYVGITGAPVVTITGVLATTASVTVGNLAITGFNSTIAPLAVSGSFTASPAALQAVSGNVTVINQVSTYDTTGNLYLAAISGALTSNLNGAVWVTGGPVAVTGTVQVTETGIRIVSGVGTFNTTVAGTVSTLITNTGPINVTGFVTTVVTGTISSSITNPIGVSGVATDRNAFYTGAGVPLYNFLPIGGRAAAPTGAGSVTGYNTGDFAILNVNQTNGGLYVNQGILQSNQDCVTTTQSGNSVVSNSAVSGLAQTVLAANPSRIAWGISNFSTGALLLIMGSTNPTTGNVHFVLQGGVNLNDGKGGIFVDSPAVWQGAVTVSGVTPGLSMTYSAWQI